MTIVRIGILGAARIAPQAAIKRKEHRRWPRSERSRPGIAAGPMPSLSKHGIRRCNDSYAPLVADPEIDAIYNPSERLHAEWTIAASEAGKHCCAKSRHRQARKPKRSRRWRSAPASS